MRFSICKSIQRIAAVACLVLFWNTSAQAQIIFETQFAEEAEEMIGQMEESVSGEGVAQLLMESARIQVEGTEEAVEGHLLIVFFGEEGEILHTVASDPMNLELEPPFIELADVMPGDRVVEGFERTLGEYGFRMNGVDAWEPPPVMPGLMPIMLDSRDVNPEIAKVLWSDVRESGVGVAFVPILNRYSGSDLEGVSVHPAMITGTVGN
jgi:hypothetical protein